MPRPPSPHIRARDAGLALAGRLRRWLIAGSLALTALLSLLAGRSLPGHARRVAAVNASASSSGTTTVAPDLSGTGTGSVPPADLQPPAQAPGPTTSLPGPVVSGGS